MRKLLRAVCWGLFLSGGFGCGGATADRGVDPQNVPTTGASSASARFELNVELRRTISGDSEWLSMLLTMSHADCANSRFGAPEAGKCEGLSDTLPENFGCTPYPWECMDSFRLERGGTVIAKSEYTPSPYDNTLQFSLNYFTQAQGSEFVIEGCGVVIRQPLDIADLPVAENLTVKAFPSEVDSVSGVEVSWDPVPLTDTVSVTTSNGDSGERCYHPGDTTSVTAGGDAACGDELIVSVSTYSAPVARDTELGPLRFSTEGTRTVRDVAVDGCLPIVD